MRIKLIALLLWSGILLSLMSCGAGAQESGEPISSQSDSVWGAVDIADDAGPEVTQRPTEIIEFMQEPAPEAASVAEAETSNVASTVEGTPSQPDAAEDPVAEFLSTMSLEDKVAQMFIVTPEALTGLEQVTDADYITEEAFGVYPVGGLVYMSGNLISAEQTRDMLSNVQLYSRNRTGLPAFLCVDEEGGTVARVGGSGKFDVPVIGDMDDVGAAGDVDAAREIGETIGGYLSDLGFNVDFAPVADVLSNPENTVVKYRSFGADPQLVADMAVAVASGLERRGVMATYKHFPGHGATAGDTHNGYAYTEKTLDDLMNCELIPFQACVEAGAKWIMVGHISLPNVDNTPASMSETLITQVLRDSLGYDGIVVTDAMNMGAITEQYSSAEAAVGAILAGADIVLMPADFYAAYQGVLSAVQSGRLTEERIDESLRRILLVKFQMDT